MRISVKLKRRLFVKKHALIKNTYKKKLIKTMKNTEKSRLQAMLTFAAMNLKKMANWTWQGPEMA
jgi:hypothetical protein